MTIFMTDEARRKYAKDYLSDEERRAIDAAVQAGRVLRVNPGVSAFATEYTWCDKANQLVLADNNTRRSFNPSNSHIRRQAKNRAENVARAKAMRAEGHTQAQIMRALRVGKTTVQKYMAEIGEPVNREKAAELGARVKKARKMWASAHKAKPDMSREDRKALLTEIAAAVGRSEDTARAYIRDTEMGTK